MPKICRHNSDCAHQGLVCRPYTRGADSEQSRHHFTFQSRGTIQYSLKTSRKRHRNGTITKIIIKTSETAKNTCFGQN